MAQGAIMDLSQFLFRQVASTINQLADHLSCAKLRDRHAMGGLLPKPVTKKETEVRARSQFFFAIFYQVTFVGDGWLDVGEHLQGLVESILWCPDSLHRISHTPGGQYAALSTAKGIKWQ